jgi:4-amino-4-deoxy-L-arabinose transferase-like glycosyltransferase
MTGRIREAGALLALAFLTRLVGVSVTTLTGLNSYAKADVRGFATAASATASTLAAGSLPIVEFRDVYQVWGLFLSPFWLLPGPSRVYARVGVALLGAYSVYNVYRMTEKYASTQAAAIAAAPMVLFPTFVFIHATILREAAVLFGLTTAFRLALIRRGRLPAWVRATAAGCCLLFALSLRPENWPLYLLVAVAGGTVFVARRYDYRVTVAVGTPTALISVMLALPFIRRLVDRVAFVRSNRAKGRTAYLTDTIPNRITEVVAFSSVGAAYFLFSPFPWMVGRPIDVVVLLQALTNVTFLGFALNGGRVLARRWPPVVFAAAVAWLVFGALIYGVGTANVGTAVRHRQMFTWFLFVLGGTGAAQYVRFDWVPTQAR